MVRKPFVKNIEEIPIEQAHGGSGSRKLLLSKTDSVSPYFQAMTKGFLPAGGVFDWHQHEGVDEYFIVLAGKGTVEFRDGTKISYSQDDLIYVPGNIEHRIENTGPGTGEFYFVRLDC